MKQSILRERERVLVEATDVRRPSCSSSLFWVPKIRRPTDLFAALKCLWHSRTVDQVCRQSWWKSPAPRLKTLLSSSKEQGFSRSLCLLSPGFCAFCSLVLSLLFLLSCCSGLKQAVMAGLFLVGRSVLELELVQRSKSGVFSGRLSRRHSCVPKCSEKCQPVITN